jgi:hypothetical protein
MTDWILEDYYLRRTWKKTHRQDVLIQQFGEETGIWI